MNQRQRARSDVLKAVRSGALIRPDLCSSCGLTGRIMGHHHDYSKPLDVEWVCPPCHGLRHRGPRKPKFWQFTKEFRAAMLASQVSISGLAAKVGMSREQITHIASGGNSPRIDHALRIAKVLRVKVESLWVEAA